MEQGSLGGYKLEHEDRVGTGSPHANESTIRLDASRLVRVDTRMDTMTTGKRHLRRPFPHLSKVCSKE